MWWKVHIGCKLCFGTLGSEEGYHHLCSPGFPFKTPTRHSGYSMGFPPSHLPSLLPFLHNSTVTSLDWSVPWKIKPFIPAKQKKWPTVLQFTKTVYHKKHESNVRNAKKIVASILHCDFAHPFTVTFSIDVFQECSLYFHI